MMKVTLNSQFHFTKVIKGYYLLFSKYQKNYIYPFFTYYIIEDWYHLIEDEIMTDSLYYYYMFKDCKNCDVDFVYLDKQLEMDNEFYKCGRLLYIINNQFYSQKEKKGNVSRPNNYINHQIKEIPVKVRSNREIDKFAKLALSLYLPYKSGIKRLMEEKGDEGQLYDGNWERHDWEGTIDEAQANDEFGEDQIEIVYENNKIYFKKNKYPFFINTRRIVMEYKRKSDEEVDIYYKKMKNENKMDYEILKDYIGNYRKKYNY